MNGAGLTLAALSGGSIDRAALSEYGIQEVEDAILILTTAKVLAKRGFNNFPDMVEGRPTLNTLRQSSDSFDGLTGNEPPDIRSLSVLLASIYNWENLGIKLGITMQKLEEIRQQYHGDLEMCKNKLYDMWLRQQTDPSWREIVDALEQIEENNIADKIRRMFMQQERPSLVRQSSAYDSPVLSHTPHSSSIGSEPVTLAAMVSPLITNPGPPLANAPLVGAGSPMLPGATILPSAPVVAVVPSLNAFHQGTPSGYIILPQGTAAASTANIVSHQSTTTIRPPISLSTSDSPTFPVQRSSQSAAYPQNTDAIEQEDPQLIDLLKAMTIEDPQQIDISCKVINAETNALIESTKPPDCPLTRDIRVTQRHPQRVQEFSSNAVPVGTSIRLEITANCECYMYILNVGTSGKIALLLPNDCDSNHFRPNQVYHLPDPELGFDIEGPPGKETLQIFAFSQKQSTLERLGETPIQEKELYRDIVIRRKKKIQEDKKGFTQVQFDVK